jgi:integrase
MRWAWIDWTAGVIRIPAAEAAHRSGVKTAYPLALNRTSRDVLQRRRVVSRAGDDGLVFPNPLKAGGVVPYDSAREAIARAISRAGVKAGTPHDLRHTYARMLSRHAPANVVQSQLGHHAAATTRIYTDLSAEDVARELEDFGVGDVTHAPDPETPRRRATRRS